MRPSPEWKRAIQFGITFEICLVLGAALPLRDVWLCAEAYRLLIFSHHPLLWFLDLIEPDSAVVGLLLVLVAGLVMAVVWALLFLGLWRCMSWVRTRFGITRRQKSLLGWGLGGVCLVVIAVAMVDVLRNRPTPFTASPAVTAAVEGNTTFGLDLYRQLKDRPGNLFFSPYSIAASLAMVQAGARGQTESEIARTLHLSPTQTNLPLAFGELTSRMDKLQRWGRITLTTANSLWCPQDHPFTDAFRKVVRTQFRAEARLVDFKDAAPAASREINAWVARKTRGRIRDLTAPGQFTPDTSVVLANAIYFKGKWAAQFKSKHTKDAPFSITPDQTVIVPMMSLKSEFRMVDVYDEDPAVQLLELPYYGQDLSMVVVLPQAVDGLPALEQKLSPDKLRAWLASLDRAPAHEASVYLPRFTTTQSFDLADVLKSLGMPTAFDVKRADLSGIDGTALLYLSGAIHRAFVEVNESGTEAAAATFFQAKGRSQSYRFVANHPFLFLIREQGSGSILFLGRVVDPR